MISIHFRSNQDTCNFTSTSTSLLVMTQKRTSLPLSALFHVLPRCLFLFLAIMGRLHVAGATTCLPQSCPGNLLLKSGCWHVVHFVLQESQCKASNLNFKDHCSKSRSDPERRKHRNIPKGQLFHPLATR